jgi:hypothetical protein
VTNHYDSGLHRHPTTARGVAETVNWDMKGADFLSVYEQARGDFLPDESLKSFTDEQLALLRLGFEECADSVLFYQRKLEHEKAAKEICQRLFTLTHR